MIDTASILPYPVRDFISWEDLAMPRLWQHPNGRYYALWEEERGTRQKSLRTSDRQEAEKRYRSFKRDLLAGRIKPISPGVRIGFKEFVDEFLDAVAKNPNLSRQTERLYTDALTKALDLWGDVPLAHITTRHVERFLANLAGRGLMASTINKHLRNVKAALRKGRKWYGIHTPLDFPPQVKERRAARFLTRDQLAQLLNQIKDREFADVCRLSAYSGLRSGEILRLQPWDVDNPPGFLRVSASRKNGREIRVPINTTMRAILERAVKHGGQRLFRFHDPTYVSRLFHDAVVAAGLTGFRFHDLRHTYGSHQAMQGTDLRTIQELMGHVSIQSTLVYAHLSPQHLIRAAESLSYGPLPVSGGKKRNAKQDRSRGGNH